ncbi:hypothetical protein LK08_23070 [Streptomyces sp. MUSC 125]|uniref:hypothetical protein n=1 Tax=unclassified Streptomyces TaxID=2593676 RepID=UPI00057E7735|nr:MULTISPECIES: hypothetical protein [unclassified Streptomyces]KIE24757.1 hypothetical protein LK08_23070 [Streptomyces sp. MUSC 125]MCH0560345.1 hypothetical protein [Streptomyces sp. MUM 16J]
MTTALYEIETSEADDGTTVPAEGIWTPGEDAADNGFVVHHGLYIAGIGAPNDDGLYPDRFVVLGHQRWADIIEAAAAFMDRIHGWRTLHLYPGDDPAELIPRIPRAVHTHGVFLRHPHPDHPCGCEWEDTWRVVWTPATEPGAVPVTAMRHPAAPAATASIPNPDEEGVPATWAA